jgi:trans-2,3-dihydro-3-hydroxyanthranilate isomerase
MADRRDPEGMKRAAASLNHPLSAIRFSHTSCVARSLCSLCMDGRSGLRHTAQHTSAEIVMTTLAYRLVNVFTQDGGVLTGNPLCVFEAGDEVDSATMQALARQFNLSETTFILRSTRANARVRIFTPSYEMPFAGHPTLGTAFVAHSLGLGGPELTLEMTAGIIPVRSQDRRWTLQANPPTWRAPTAPRAQLAAMLSIDERDIGARPLWIKAGKEQLIIPLTNEAAVRRVRPIVDLFSKEVSEDGHAMAYVFAETAPGRILARFFFPNDAALLEDPATGSATANLGGWFIANERAPVSVAISQGEYVQRPSTLFLDVDANRNIFVSGEVIELGRGTLKI